MTITAEAMLWAWAWKSNLDYMEKIMPIKIYSFHDLRNGDIIAMHCLGSLWFWYDGGPFDYVT
jgi:hypothetical protein